MKLHVVTLTVEQTFDNLIHMDDRLARIGSRLEQWRNQRGMTQSQLAAAIDGMTQPKLSKVEQGQRKLSTVELADAAHALGIDPLELIEETPMMSGVVAAGRGGEATIANEALSLAGDLLRTWDLISNDGYDVLRSPRPDIAHDEEPIRAGQQGAAAVRQWLHLGDGPIKNMLDVCSPAGLLVAYRPFQANDGAEFDGACVAHAGRAVSVVNTARKTRGRQRFSLAHELAHWIFGDVDLAPCIDEGVYRSSNDEEARANSFAANLLLPQSVLADVTTAEQAVRLAYSYGLSVQSVAWHVHNTLADSVLAGQLRSANKWDLAIGADCLDAYVEDRDAAGRSGISPRFERAVRQAHTDGAISASRLSAVLPGIKD